jgi:hypothetical protein
MAARQTLRITVGQAQMIVEYITLIIEPDTLSILSFVIDFIVIDNMINAVPI